MLDLMRKHATSWMIKLILGAIIISFAFFFGYSQYDGNSEGTVSKGDIVARVNGHPISGEQFEFFYAQNLDRLKQAFADQELNENVRNFAQSMTLQQIIRRDFLLNAAKQAGIKISDEQLASVIRKNIETINNGKFDPIFYKHQYLPYYQNRFGINYEDIIRQDLSISTLEQLFKNLPYLEVKLDEQIKTIMWTFKIVEIEAENKSTSITSEEVQNELLGEQKAQSFINAPIESWEALANIDKAVVQKIGPISLAEKNKVLQGLGTFENYKTIFSLNQNSPVLKQPIKHGDKIFVIGLIEQKEVSKENEKNNTDSTNITSDFLNLWLQQEMSEAEVETFQ
ncbi:MAG: SurA N-terminal domain-containing protein [Pseudomonadota bacterium]